MSDERQGWTQWREGDTLHEVRPALGNDWQTLHTTYFGHFSEHQRRSRRILAEIVLEEFKKRSLMAKFLSNTISDTEPKQPSDSPRA